MRFRFAPENNLKSSALRHRLFMFALRAVSGNPHITLVGHAKFLVCTTAAKCQPRLFNGLAKGRDDAECSSFPVHSIRAREG